MEEAKGKATAALIAKEKEVEEAVEGRRKAEAERDQAIKERDEAVKALEAMKAAPPPATAPPPPPPPPPVDIAKRREEHDGQIGYVTISLAWNTKCDLDLHLKGPNGLHISCANTKAAGGELDIDANSPNHPMESPVENIYFMRPPPPGEYSIEVENYENRNNGKPTEFEVYCQIDPAKYRTSDPAKQKSAEATFRYPGKSDPTNRTFVKVAKLTSHADGRCVFQAV